MPLVTASELKPGLILSRQAYYYVEHVTSRGVTVRNLKNNTWHIPKDVFENECFSTEPRSSLPASQRVRVCSLTKLVDVLHSVRDKIFRVKYTKKDGSERVMVAYHKGCDTSLGRSRVMELYRDDDDGTFNERERQVDHRTLKSIVFAGYAYELGRRRSSPPNPEEKEQADIEPLTARVADLQAGHMVSRLSYCVVESISGIDNTIRVRNLKGKSWNIGRSIVTDEFYSCALSTTPETRNLTQLCEQLHTVGDKVFQVTFTKKNGDKRTMVGRHWAGHGLGALASWNSSTATGPSRWRSRWTTGVWRWSHSPVRPTLKGSASAGKRKRDTASSSSSSSSASSSSRKKKKKSSSSSSGGGRKKASTAARTTTTSCRRAAASRPPLPRLLPRSPSAAVRAATASGTNVRCVGITYDIFRSTRE